MTDIRKDLAGLMRLTGPGDGSAGRTVMFVAARSSDGTPMLARAFAQMVAERSQRGVWLVDLDLCANAQYEHFAFTREDGGPGRPLDGSMGGHAFWRVVTQSSNGLEETPTPRHMFTLHQIGTGKLHVARFRAEALRPGQRVQVLNTVNWWQQARASCDLVVVDAPALDRSRVALAVCAHIDQCVLVLDSEQTDPRDAAALRDDLLARGARIAGVVMNKAARDRGGRG